jgi:hypothetical protein
LIGWLKTKSASQYHLTNGNSHGGSFSLKIAVWAAVKRFTLTPYKAFAFDPITMKVSAVFYLAVLGGCITEASAYNPFGGSRDSSSRVEHQQAPPFKFDYKLSFKRPFYYNNSIPHWQESGGKKLIDIKALPTIHSIVWSGVSLFMI